MDATHTVMSRPIGNKTCISHHVLVIIKIIDVSLAVCTCTGLANVLRASHVLCGPEVLRSQTCGVDSHVLCLDHHPNYPNEDVFLREARVAPEKGAAGRSLPATPRLNQAAKSLNR